MIPNATFKDMLTNGSMDSDMVKQLAAQFAQNKTSSANQFNVMNKGGACVMAASGGSASPTSSSGAPSSSSILADSDDKEQFIQSQLLQNGLGGNQWISVLLQQQQQQQQKGGDMSDMIRNASTLMDMLANGSGDMVKQLAAQFAQNKTNENDADDARESSPSPPPAVSLNSTLAAMVLPTTSTSTGCSAPSTASSVDSAASSVMVNRHLASQTSAVDEEEPAPKKVKVVEEDTPATPTSSQAQLMQFIQQMGLVTLQQQNQKQMKESQNMMGLGQFFPPSLGLPFFPSALHQQLPGVPFLNPISFFNMNQSNVMSHGGSVMAASGVKQQQQNRKSGDIGEVIINAKYLNAMDKERKLALSLKDHEVSPLIRFAHYISNLLQNEERWVMLRISQFFERLLELSKDNSDVNKIIKWWDKDQLTFKLWEPQLVAAIWGIYRKSDKVVTERILRIDIVKNTNRGLLGEISPKDWIYQLRKTQSDENEDGAQKSSTETALQMVVQNQNQFDGDSSTAALNLTLKNDGVKKEIDEEKVAGNQNHERNSHTSGSISTSGSIGDLYPTKLNECPFPKQTFLIRCNDGSGEFLTEFLANIPVRSVIDGPRKVVFDLHPAPAAN